MVDSQHPAPPSSPPLPPPNDEKFNELSPERKVLLDRLQTLLGRDNVPRHFVAAAFICDIRELENLVNLAAMKATFVLSMSHQSYDMLRICE